VIHYLPSIVLSRLLKRIKESISKIFISRAYYYNSPQIYFFVYLFKTHEYFQMIRSININNAQRKCTPRWLVYLPGHWHRFRHFSESCMPRHVLFMDLKPHDRVTPVLQQLLGIHVPVAERIQYKLCFLVHKLLLAATCELGSTTCTHAKAYL